MSVVVLSCCKNWGKQGANWKLVRTPKTDPYCKITEADTAFNLFQTPLKNWRRHDRNFNDVFTNEKQL